MDTRRSLLLKSYLPPGPCDDTIDHTVLKFGTEISLRGNIGLYLQAVPVSTDPNNSSTPAIYMLDVKGQGIGEPLDCMTIVNLDKK